MGNPARAHRPDVLLARGMSRGYRWEVARAGYAGFRCGYVRVPSGHPWYGKEGSSILACAYGGLDFAQADTSAGGWWLGFHTMHAMDVPDPGLFDPDADPESRLMYELLSKHGGHPPKSTHFVIEQCERLIAQADDVATDREPTGVITVDDLSLPQMLGVLGALITAPNN